MRATMPATMASDTENPKARPASILCMPVFYRMLGI